MNRVKRALNYRGKNDIIDITITVVLVDLFLILSFDLGIGRYFGV